MIQSTFSETPVSSFHRALSIHICTMSEDQHVYERHLRTWLQAQGHTILTAPGDLLSKKLKAAQDCDLCLVLLGPEFGPREFLSSFSHTELEVSAAVDTHPGKVLIFAQRKAEHPSSPEQREFIERWRDFTHGTFQAIVNDLDQDKPEDFLALVDNALKHWESPKPRQPAPPRQVPANALMISSTGDQDMLVKRSIAHAILEERQIPIIDYLDEPSEPVTPIDRVISWARECKTLLLILGDRYGYISPVDGSGITELEFVTALRANRPILAFIGHEAEKTEDLDQRQFVERVQALLSTEQIMHFNTLETFKQKLQIQLDRLQAGESFLHTKLHKITPEMTQAWYRRQLQRWLGKIPHLTKPEGIPLAHIYVSLRIRLEPKSEDPRSAFSRPKEQTTPGQEQEQKEITKSFEPLLQVDMALRRYPRLILRGDPGSGKTVTLRWYALNASKEIVPVILRLASYAKEYLKKTKEGLHYTLMDAIADEEERLALRAADEASTWITAIEAGRGLILLDALDEVPVEKQSIIAKDIDELALQLPLSTRIVVTARKAGFTLPLSSSFTVTDVQPLDLKQQRQLVEQWLAVAHSLENNGDIVVRERTQRLLEWINSQQHLEEWARTPLLLTFLAALSDTTELEFQVTPFTKVVVYQKVLRLILGRWATLNQRHGGQHLWAKEQMLLKLAKTGAIERQEEIFDQETFTQIWKSLPKIGRKVCDVEELLRELNAVDGMLIRLGEGRYTFFHPVFQEYMTALSLAQDLQKTSTREDTWNDIAGLQFFGRWTEILRLLVGVLTYENTKTSNRLVLDWLTFLVSRRQSSKGDPGNLSLLLALASLSEIPETSRVWQIIKGTDLGRDLAKAWIDELLNAVREKHQAQLVRLQRDAAQIGRLSLPALKEPLDLLLAALYDRRQHVRVTAAEAIGQFGEYAPIEPLLDIMNDRYGEFLNQTALAAARALGSLRERVPIQALIKALYSNNRYIINAAKEAFKAMGNRVPADKLLLILDSNDRKARAAAVEVLGQLGAQAPLDLLVQVLQDRDASVRAAAVEALGQLGTQVPLDLLVPALQDKEERVRAAAARALGQLGTQAPLPPLVQALEDSKKTVRMAAIEAFEQLGDYAPINMLLLALNDQEEEVCVAATRVLGQLGQQVYIETFIDIVKNKKSRKQQVSALEALEHFGNQVPIEPITEALSNQDSMVSATAARLLSKLRKPIPMAQLVRILANDDQKANAIVGETLSQLDESITIDEFVQILHRKWFPLYLKAAAEVLTGLSQKIPSELLLPALNDQNKEIRLTAVHVLGKSGDQDSVHTLVQALEDKSDEVIIAAVEALGQLGEQAPIEPLVKILQEYRSTEPNPYSAFSFSSPRTGFKGSTEVRAAAVHVLSRLGERIPIKIFVDALNDPAPDVQKAAVEAIGSLGEQAPIEPFVKILQEHRYIEPNPHAAFSFSSPRTGFKGSTEVRVAAVHALSRLGERVAIEIFMDTLNDQELDVRKATVQVLGQRGDNTSIHALIQSLNDRDEQVCISAIQSLGQLGKKAPINVLTEVFRDKQGEKRALVEQRKPNEPIPIEIRTYEYISGELVQRDPNSGIRSAAVRALGQAGKDAHTDVLAVLIEALHDEDIHVCIAAMNALRELGVGVPIEPLLEVFDESITEVRIAAIEMFGKLKDKTLISPLLEALKESDKSIRIAAIRALVNFGEDVTLDVFIQALNDGEDEVAEASMLALGQKGESASTNILIDILLGRDIVGGADAISYDEFSIERLGNLFHEVNVDEYRAKRQAAAASALGQLGGHAPIKPLIEAMGYRDEEVRKAAIIALSHMGTDVPAEPLLRALGDSSDKVRNAAIETLNILHPDALLKVMQEAVDALYGRKPGSIIGSLMYGIIVDTIGEMKYAHGPFITELTKMLYWSYWEVRMKAAQALGKLARNIPFATIERLMELRSDQESQAVREAADNALFEILSQA